MLRESQAVAVIRVGHSATAIGQRNRRQLVVIRPCVGGNVAADIDHLRAAIIVFFIQCKHGLFALLPANEG